MTTDARSALDLGLTFGMYTLGDRHQVLQCLRQAIDALPRPPTPSSLARELLPVLRAAIADLPASRSTPPEKTLPAVWLGELTRPLPPELVHTPEKLAALTGAMRRVCLTAVLRSLPETLRGEFVLRHILGLPDAEIARALGSSERNLTVARSRARLRIQQKLGPHCGHLDPLNPCSCMSRLAIALDEGALRDTDCEPATSPDPRCDGDFARLFQSLPRYRLTDAQAAPLLAKLSEPTRPLKNPRGDP